MGDGLRGRGAGRAEPGGAPHPAGHGAREPLPVLRRLVPFLVRIGPCLRAASAEDWRSLRTQLRNDVFLLGSMFFSGYLITGIRFFPIRLTLFFHVFGRANYCTSSVMEFYSFHFVS